MERRKHLKRRLCKKSCIHNVKELILCNYSIKNASLIQILHALLDNEHKKIIKCQI